MWLVHHDHGAPTEDHRHVVRGVHEVLAVPGVRVDRARVLVGSLRSLAARLRSQNVFSAVEARVFVGDHSVSDEELAALVAWWLRR